PKTEAWHLMVSQGLTEDDADISEALDRMGRPDVLTATLITDLGGLDAESSSSLDTPIGRKRLTHQLAREGYSMFRCPDRTDGRWKVRGRATPVYVRRGAAKPGEAVSRFIKGDAQP